MSTRNNLYRVVLFCSDSKTELEWDVSAWVHADMAVSAVAIATYQLGLVFDPRVQIIGAEARPGPFSEWHTRGC